MLKIAFVNVPDSRNNQHDSEYLPRTLGITVLQHVQVMQSIDPSLNPTVGFLKGIHCEYYLNNIPLIPDISL